MRLEDGVIREARLCLTGVGSRPVRVTDAENALLGHPLTSDVADAVAEAVRASIDPSSDLHASGEYRRAVAGTLAARAVSTAVERARQHLSSATSQEALR